MRNWGFTLWAHDTPMVKHARQAVRDGFAVVFLRPGRKDPLCPLTAREKQKAGPNHPCGVSHASTDEKWVVKAATRLEREYGQINLGIAAHASGVVVIDADTPEQVESIADLLRQFAEVGVVYGATVSTPGAEVNGVKIHSGGTHWYFDRPEGLELPLHPGEMALPGGAVMRWGNSYTVVPPSVRAEGRYVSLTDNIPELPQGLAVMIFDRIERSVHAAAEAGSLYTNDPVVEWSVRTPWSDLLEPQGWQFLGKLDNVCHCPVWKRPGEDSTSDRSAIAHENDCSLSVNFEGHGALHVFSDNVPGPLGEHIANTGRRHVTKLQFVALTAHDGDEAAAQIALGLTPDYYEMWTGAEGSGQTDNDPPPYTSAGPKESPNGPPDEEAPAQEALTLAQMLAALAKEVSAETGDPLLEVAKEVAREVRGQRIRKGVTNILGDESPQGSSWLPVDPAVMLEAADRDRTQSDEGVLERSDGATLFTVGKLHELFGQSSAGKSFMMKVAMLQQVTAGHRVMYCDFEDRKETFVDRYLLDLGVDIRPYLASGQLCYCNPTSPPGDVAKLVALGFRLVVVDSLSELVASVQDGSMKDGVLLRRLLGTFRRLAEGGAAVVIIAHGSEKVDVPGSSMGASEIRQALTGQDVLLHIEQQFNRRRAGRSLIYIAKDRGGDVSGDSDTNDALPNKVQRQLWGAMVVTPEPPDELLGRTTWTTVIEIEPAKHKEPEEKEKAIDRAERLIIVYLRDRKDETARVADMTDDLVDENDGVADRTVRRAVRKLLDDRLVHEVGQESTSAGGRPSLIIKLGPAPE